jgi:hypothetical protein
MWFNVAFMEGKKLVRFAAKSSAVSAQHAFSRRWFAHALLYASTTKWRASEMAIPI